MCDNSELLKRSIDRLADQADAQSEMGRLYLALFLREQHEARTHLSRVETEYHINDARGRLRPAMAPARRRPIRRATGIDCCG